MKIKRNSQDKICIELTCDEMRLFNLTYESMDCKSADTQRAVLFILKRIKEELGYEIDPKGKMIIEASPLNLGGCLLIISSCCGTVKSAQSEKFGNLKYAVYEFKNLDSLMDFAFACPQKLKLIKNEVYKDGKSYILIFSSSKSIPKNPLIEEFSNELCPNPLFVCKIHEHCKRIAEDNALSKLSKKAYFNIIGS